ncbi:sigma-70 family RNA polymerase sigma factor [uncultured Sphingomonas sp.]|uniref:sigma-70 family RNA polymerase sigma factor n=1 Tax=uncultured Sphingomonas sp. TaxID=158754 RepID=UPI0035CBF6E1
MSKITAALEAAVATVILNTPVGDVRQTNRQRVEGDRAFAAILKLVAPRIRHFIRQYGLIAHWDDAEQCCAIGVHRAIQAYDPSKAQFTTFVNWQLRGELQGLRFRLMTDQRPSAKKVAATTVSLSAGIGEDDSLESMIVDHDALERTEAGAAAYLAGRTRTMLIEQYVDHLRAVGMDQLKRRARDKADRPTDLTQPRLRATMYPVDPTELAALEEKIALHREAIERRLSDEVEAPAVAASTPADDAVRERSRQIAKRAAGAIAEIAQRTPHLATPRWQRPVAATATRNTVSA